MRCAVLVLISVATFSVAQEELLYKDPALKPEDRDHWSFIAPKRPTVPTVRARQRVRNPIDAFVLAKLEAQNMTLAPEADKRTLIRRLTFDLHGLPPTVEQIDAFLADNSPDAYEKLVDRLLASPHYGERWGQHWLDAVRYAESNGYELDGERPHAWRYRDYVIRSLNEDKPYSQFLTEQLAGDLLAAGQPPRDVAHLLDAASFHRLGQTHVVSGNLDKDETRQEVLTEMVTGVGSAMLGLTIACARCHDHKFDPISAGDYYRLQAFFAGTVFKDVNLATDAEKDAINTINKAIEAKLAPLRKQIQEIDAAYRPKVLAMKKAALEPDVRAALEVDPTKRTPEQKKLADGAAPALKISWDDIVNALSPEDKAKRDQLKAQEAELLRHKAPPPATAWTVTEQDKPPPTHVLKRGEVRKKSIQVQPAALRVIGSSEPLKSRLDLAKWLTSPSHPLTARVIVNRLWHGHFGRGIVATLNDLGTRGEPPTHPELLDWLAVELVQPSDPSSQPWSLKRIHRLMVTSSTYRQVSRGTKPAGDPDNKLLSQMNRRRLEAEAIRDAMLTAAGTLNREMYGRSVKVPLEPEVYDLIFTEGEPFGLWPVTVDVKQHTRRSIYLFLKRNVRLPLFEAFDQPDTLTPCAGRGVSTFAPQALILMNSPFTLEQSLKFAESLREQATGNVADLVKQAYRRALGRWPTDAELKLAKEFLKQQTAELVPRWKDDAAKHALADLCRALFNVNEFVYVD